MLHSSRNYSVEHLEEQQQWKQQKCITHLVYDQQHHAFFWIWLKKGLLYFVFYEWVFLSSCSVYKFILSNLTYLNAPHSSSFFIL